MTDDAQQTGIAGSSAETREIDTFQSDKCPACLGDGYIGQHANLPDVKCQNCSGTGFVDTGPHVELLIENLVQAAAEYENNCDRLVAKTIRVQLEKAKQAIRDAILTTQPQAPSHPEGDRATDEDWRDDPAADERWQAGCDFALVQLCHAIGVDPKSVRWDAATETLDGDVNAVIWNILRAKMGEDWDPHALPSTQGKT